LTDSSVQYLAGVCHYIESLNLSECGLLTDRSLRFVRKGLKLLKDLNVLYCSNITKASVKKLLTRCQHILHSTDQPPLLVSSIIDPKVNFYNPGSVLAT
ncbi:Hypothetical predicted protein, partial [Paramuricea clavata]